MDKLQRLRLTHDEKQEAARLKHEELQRKHQELLKVRSAREAEDVEQKKVYDQIQEQVMNLMPWNPE